MSMYDEARQGARMSDPLIDAKTGKPVKRQRPPAVDWLDEGWESCLIDGVRYRRAGSSNVEKLLVEWEREGRFPYDRNVLPLLRAAVEADQREGREGWDECWVRRGSVTGLLHLANKDDPRAVKILVPIDHHTEGGET